MARSHLVTGAKVKVFLNGRVFGRVLAFRFSSATPKKPIHGIDSTEPYELAVTTTSCKGSITILRLSGDGGAEGAGIAAPYPELSREQYFSLTVVEHHTDRVLFRANRCSLLNQDWDFPAKGLVVGTLQFEAIDWDNELSTQPSLR